VPSLRDSFDDAFPALPYRAFIFRRFAAGVFFGFGFLISFESISKNFRFWEPWLYPVHGVLPCRIASSCLSLPLPIQPLLAGLPCSAAVSALA